MNANPDLGTDLKKILARGGIEFLAVLLGISGSLWIENNKEIAEFELEKEDGLQILIQKEIDQIIVYTESKIQEYQIQTTRIEILGTIGMHLNLIRSVTYNPIMRMFGIPM